MDAIQRFLDLFPPAVRDIFYKTQGFVSVAIAATLVGFQAAGEKLPTWLVVTMAVLAFLGAGNGALASRNTPKE